MTAGISRYQPIAEYGIIGAMHTCALVSKTGSIDFCCLPAFDSPATFSRLLDWRRGGYFQVAPPDIQSVDRRYLPETNILETTFNTTSGVARLTDFMPVHAASRSRILLAATDAAPVRATYRLKHPSKATVGLAEAIDEPFEIEFEEKIIRILECVSGSVDFRVECYPRFEYGTISPRVVLDEVGPHYGLAHGGANALLVYCSEPLEEADRGFVAQGRLQTGQRLSAAVAGLSHFTRDYSSADEWLDMQQIDKLLDRTIRFWRGWSAGIKFEGRYRPDVVRSALALKALTYEPSGALLAAATTSLPERLGGERNWDYRFTWIRDATFSLMALADLGLIQECVGFKNWLEWTAAYPEDLQLMYGIRGERLLPERELPLEGYNWSRPVRIGNAASTQFQLDLYGELMDSAYLFQKLTGEPVDNDYWTFLSAVADYTIEQWRLPDAGMWETRGGNRHFVFSKVMCWVALDRAIWLAEHSPNIQADTQRWKAVREEIRDEILTAGFDARLGVFVQSYGSRVLDASTLMMPLVGFIDAKDPRMRSTIDAIERELTSPAGLLYRYRGFDDGLSGGEGTFILCSFWLVQNLILLGELDRARTLFEKLRGYANDLGLFSEEVDTDTGEMLGNFPQAFSHLAFIESAVMLNASEQRSQPKDGAVKREIDRSLPGPLPRAGAH
jgi:GH15 family glucan-1,4-alpha-glucosidase